MWQEFQILSYTMMWLVNSLYLRRKINHWSAPIRLQSTSQSRCPLTTPNHLSQSTHIDKMSEYTLSLACLLALTSQEYFSQTTRIRLAVETRIWSLSSTHSCRTPTANTQWPSQPVQCQLMSAMTLLRRTLRYLRPMIWISLGLTHWQCKRRLSISLTTRKRRHQLRAPKSIS